MRRLLCSIIVGLTIAASGAPAQSAAPTGGTVQIRAAPLGQALGQLTRQTGMELLYDQHVVEGATSSEVRGKMPAEQALARLLAGTGVTYRKTAEGVFVLFAEVRAGGEARQEPPVPEILIIGVRTQNADIRRTRNDIQPYVVSSRSDIENAHPDNLGEFFRSRITADAQSIAPAQNTVSDPGAVNSNIDLRGLGSLRTLVLVDGRRMPSLPTPQFDFGQADINALPISAVERIETLTGTAGGIYGPGAMGGVINIILRRDYRGADVHLVSGISSRGDARRLGIEARIGFTPDHGRTDVMIFAARTTLEPLLTGDRDYQQRARRRRFESNPAGYLAAPPTSNAITVYSQAGNLSFDPEFGEGALGSPVTYLPIGFSGSLAERTALLTANAGTAIFDVAPDQTGTRKYLLSNPTITSGIVNVRHRFGGGLEAFADLLYFRDDGRYGGDGEPVSVTVRADAANNPFQQPVIFEFPHPSISSEVRTKLESKRLTAGLIADLRSGWKGSAEVTLGEVQTGDRGLGQNPGLGLQFALQSGHVDPLGNYGLLTTAIASFNQSFTIRTDQVNRFGAASVRAAGPLAQLAGGPLSLTLLAEQRREHAPSRQANFEFGPIGIHFPFPIRRQSVTSGYAEVRAPLLPQDARSLLRGLELQLAARYDRVGTLVPENAQPVSPSNDQLTRITNGGLTFTAGTRLFPARSLMLRGSVATGELPPTIEQLAVNEIDYDQHQQGPPDARRANRFLGSEGPAIVRRLGSHDLSSERATTISIGAVLNPNGTGLPRLSIDYSRIDVRREVSFISSSIQSIIANEENFPGRVVRAPLTDEDRALGFTEGRILSVDATAFNGGRTHVETVDAQLDWTVRAGEQGQMRLYGNATWYPSFKSKKAPGTPWVSHLGYFDGLLAWRGNVGIDWTRGPLTVGVNAQYYDHYRATYRNELFAPLDSTIIANQGATWIPAQAYVDLYVRQRFITTSVRPLRSVDVSFGIRNVFDHRPPLVAQASLQGYSFYGDPRRRRFELVLSGRL